jgi:hypothetical protein
MFGQICDREMIDCIENYISDLEELKALYPGGSCQVEKKVSLQWAGYKDVFGTADFIFDELFGTLGVCDFKSGSGVVVEPEKNGQLMSYALMAAGKALMSYRQIVIAISQPRAKTMGKSLKIWETTPQHLMQWFKDTLEPTILAIASGDRTTVPSEDSCRFCKACDICPSYSRMALDLARMDFADAAPAAPIVNDVLVERVYRHIPLLKDWIKRVEAHAFVMVGRGSLPGFKLVSGRRTRSWSDEREAIKILEGAGIDPYEKKILSPAKAEKAGREVRKKIQKIIKISDGKPVIAPKSDKRKAVSLAAEDFKNIA